MWKWDQCGTGELALCCRFNRAEQSFQMQNGSRLERAVNKTLNVALVIAGALAFGLICLRFVESQDRKEGIPLGDRAETDVVPDDGREPSALADLAPGTCRYVVFYWSACDHCRALAVHWRQDLAIEGPDVLPPGWTAIWVSRTANPTMDFPLPGIPVITARPVTDDALTDQLGITGYPFYAILFRERACRWSATSWYESPIRDLFPFHREAELDVGPILDDPFNRSIGLRGIQLWSGLGTHSSPNQRPRRYR
jgi:hypothetical protein